MVRRVLHPSFALVIVVGCLGESVDYSPDKDVQAFDDIARTYAASGDMQLSLCEDTAATGPTDGNTCQVEHVVRGNGSAPAQHEKRGGGCGGCPFGNYAYVRGTLSGPSLAQPLAITGEVHLGVGASADPYDYPYDVELACVAPATCTLGGELHEDGTLTIDYVDIAGVSQPALAFTASGPAACGAPLTR